jgi:hypothetical protein
MKVTRKRHYVNETPEPFKQTGINRSLRRGVVGLPSGRWNSVVESG